MGPGSPPRSRQVLFAAAGVLAFVVAVAGWIGVRSYQREAAYHRRVPRTVPLDDAEGLTVREVTFSSGSSTLAGWYVPGDSGAVLVMVHGSSGDRRSVVPEARLLADAGHGVLLFDLPGHGESDGEVTWGTAMAAAVRAAVEHVTTLDGVDPGRVGAVGVSMGGFAVVQAAAVDDRIAAVVLIGTPHDHEAVTRWQNRRWGVLSQLPALWAMEDGGLPRDSGRPVDLIAAISPRPVLVVGGSADAVVPLRFSRELFEAAGEPRALLTIEGGGHGDHVETGGSAFESTVLGFVSEHLQGAAEPSSQ